MSKNGRLIFINLAVKDLKKSKEFFSKLGFSYDPKYTDDNAACMIISDKAYVMLLSEPFFKGFTRKGIADTSTQSEGLFAFSCESRAEVDRLTEIALANGGKRAMDPNDMGFMYNTSFYDLDGHHWEVMWMDPNASQEQVQGQPKQ